MTMKDAHFSRGSVIQAVGWAVSTLERLALVVAPLALRIALALPFFRSGLTRWDGFLSLSPSAAYLFEEEFKLHLFGGAYDIPMPLLTAHTTATAEIVLPILLALGLGTRFAALGLLVMTGVIQLVVPDGWANFHLPWAAMALGLIALGPGPLSLDHVLRRLCHASAPGSERRRP
ncbi:MAG: DoxX family protein [Bradyrhizobium sp.]|nr:DoxX family protein [Bradyrhizobium sp.]